MGELVFEKDSIIVLSGVPASGKSTFAKKYFKEEQILSTDLFRKMLGGVFNINNTIVPNQNVSSLVFKKIEEFLEERAKHGYLTVIDATNLEWQQIKPWKKIADKYNRNFYILFFDVDLDTIKEWNEKRKEKVEEDIIKKFVEKKENFFNSSKIKELENEGKIIKINPKREYKIKIKPESGSVIKINKENVIIVGDLHGDLEALNKILEYKGFYIFVGDVIDRGPNSLEVLLEIMELVKKNKAILILGNHEQNLLKALSEEKEQLSPSTAITYNELIETDYVEEVKEFLKSLPKGVILNNKFFISHSFVDIDPYKDFTYQYSDYSLVNTFGYTSDEQINNNTSFILVHGHVNNSENIIVNGIYNLTDRHKEKNEYFILFADTLEIKKIETNTKQIVRFGSSFEDLKEIYPSLKFLLELKEFDKKFPKYLNSMRTGRFEIFKYSNRAFWDFQKRKFNITRSPLMYARGHVFDYYTYSFVVVPFPKFFNLNETPRHTYSYVVDNILPLSDKMIITEKINGFLVNIAKTFDNKIIVSTSSSLESKHVEIAKINLERFIGKDWEEKLKSILPRGITIMTELVAPEDYFNHIVATPEQFGFHLLAYSFDYKNKHPKDAKILPFAFENDSTNKLKEQLKNIGFREISYKIKEPTAENFEKELRNSLEEKNKEGSVIYFMKEDKIIEVLKLKYKDYLLKKAKKRNYTKKIKVYENLDFKSLITSPYEDF